MPLKPITAQAARELARQGALLVDIRSRDEHARERIAHAICLPMDQLKGGEPPLDGAKTVIFHCRSGNRTLLGAQTLAECANGQAYVLEGGLDAWKKAGLPVVKDSSQPLELQRQVQIAAGSMVLAGTALGTVISPWFYALSAFVGAGLVFAGVSGFCGLARVLTKMPWNRRARAV